MSWLSVGLHQRTIHVDGRVRHYLVYVPATAALTRPVPVHLTLHGSNSNGQVQLEFTGLNDHADQHGYVVVYPFGTGARARLLFWNAGICCGDAWEAGVDDVGFISNLLTDLEQLIPLDHERIYISGMSNGAMMAYRLANELSLRIAAIAAVAGPMAIRQVAPQLPVSVIHIHGDQDEFTPFLGGNGPRSVTRTQHLSVPETISAWVVANGCPALPAKTTLRPIVDDGTVVELAEYGPGRDGAEVHLYTILGGGHTWPNRPPRPYYLGKSSANLIANDVIWQFFQRHRRNI
ncbi:MAG: PHB depolymerase family esterase [Pirellulales bacterium]|nr:PHB depolymerase family esterase [Pirellulales bacterium]